MVALIKVLYYRLVSWVFCLYCLISFPKSLHADNALYFSIPWVYNAVAWEKLFPREEKTGDRGAGKVGCGKNITFNTNRSLARNSLLADLGLMVISFYGAV